MNGLLIFFDGIPQDLDNFNGTESASFVFRRKDEQGDSAFSFAPELTLVGSSYDYVKQQIINAVNPNIAGIEVLVYDTCCLNTDGSNRLLFTGKIEGGSVRWCTFPTCEAQVTIIDNSQDALAIRCLKEHFPWSTNNTMGFNIPNPVSISLDTNGYDQFRVAPYMYYCNDPKPSAIQEAIMILGIFIFIAGAPILLFLQLGNIIGGNGQNVFEDLTNLIVGCGRRHVTPFLDSQFKNLCKLCQIGYQSSLFDVGGYYHDTVRLDAAYVPGVRAYPWDRVGESIYNLDNKPNLNGIQFLDQLKQLNIDWRVVNGILTIERKDYFAGSQWFDTANLQPNQLLSVCYESLGERPASYAEYEYILDGIDNSGDEVRRKWVDRVIDWNGSNNPQQLGLFSKKLFYGAAQFRDDWAAPDTNPIDKPFYVTFYPLAQDAENTAAMFITKGVLTYPKLINLKMIAGQDLTNANFSRGVAIPDAILMSNGKKLYNYKWHIKSNPIVAANGQSYDTAYQRLFYIDDPRLTSVKTRKVTISVTADCDLLDTLDVDRYITTEQGQVQITEITYDTNNNSLTIQGLI
jgi:hypothetical protein